MSVATKHHTLTDAEVCRRNGWSVGTKLVGDEGFGPTVLTITAIGESCILTRPRRLGVRQGTTGEQIWTLRYRDWQEYTGA